MEIEGKRKMLSELIKFSSQHRAIYCFLIMSLWIFLIIAGMYKYIAMEEGINAPRPQLYKKDSPKGDSRFKKLVTKYCNPAEEMHVGGEGLADDSWALQGVLIAIRHGDRGPLTHVRNVETADCNVPASNPLLQRYQGYVNNMTGLGKAPWSQSPGPFHNIPLLPTIPLSECRLGQLTPRGLLQLLTIGNILGQIYTSRLGWDFHGNTSDAGSQTHANNDLELNKSGNTKTKIIDAVKKVQQIKPINEEAKLVAVADKPAEGDIVVHSTRYRRAFQSALAFMWSVLGAAGSTVLSTSTAKESPSLTFCAEDCACPAAEHYASKVSRESKKRLESHPAITQLIDKLSNIVFQSPSQGVKDPHIVEDALLTYLCHSAPLPCVQKPLQNSDDTPHPDKYKDSGNIRTLSKGFRTLLSYKSRKVYNSRAKVKKGWLNRKLFFVESQKKKPVLDFDAQMEKEKLGYYKQKMMENADLNNYEDVILIKRNMDGDFNFNGDRENINNPEMEEGESEEYDNKDEKLSEKKVEEGELSCVNKDHVLNLFSYTDWELSLVVKSRNYYKASLLRAYGMLHQIVKYILKMISKGQPKFVLFSGHDKTLQYLSIAFGLYKDNILNMHYASRLTIEVYKNEDKDYLRNRKNNLNHKPKVAAPLDFFLRIILNGEDVTRQVTFCRGNRSIKADNLMKSHVSSKGKGKAYLCRIENIIRFAHEDYFSAFNSTNFKDSCNTFQ